MTITKRTVEQYQEAIEAAYEIWEDEYQILDSYDNSDEVIEAMEQLMNVQSTFIHQITNDAEGDSDLTEKEYQEVEEYAEELIFKMNRLNKEIPHCIGIYQEYCEQGLIHSDFY